ncbi:MAG: SatD family protein [candidate division WOR-3 bacterium]
MVENKIYAVITGDIVKSRKLGKYREKALSILKETLNSLTNFKGDSIGGISDIFRGDSFQIVVSKPAVALKIVIFLKAQLLTKTIEEKNIDVRIAIGIGKTESLNKENIPESDGEAFRLSGSALDNISKYRRLSIKSDIDELNKQLEFIASSLDSITRRWSTEQAEAILLWLSGNTQTSISKKIGISQPAVNQRLQLGGHFALKESFELFKHLIEKNYKL